jgi:hypothetical protein
MTDKSIEDRLRSKKPARTAPAGLTERVMSRLPERQTKTERAHARSVFWPRFALSFATVAIALVIAGEFWKRSGSGGTTSAVSAVPSIQSENAVEVASAGPIEIPIPAITSEQLQALTEKIDQPLEKELKNVISDTRLAIQFVASNFLPEQ